MGTQEASPLLSPTPLHPHLPVPAVSPFTPFLRPPCPSGHPLTPGEPPGHCGVQEAVITSLQGPLLSMTPPCPRLQACPMSWPRGARRRDHCRLPSFSGCLSPPGIGVGLLLLDVPQPGRTHTGHITWLGSPPPLPPTRVSLYPWSSRLSILPQGLCTCCSPSPKGPHYLPPAPGPWARSCSPFRRGCACPHPVPAVLSAHATACDQLMSWLRTWFGSSGPKKADLCLSYLSPACRALAGTQQCGEFCSRIREGSLTKSRGW